MGWASVAILALFSISARAGPSPVPSRDGEASEHPSELSTATPQAHESEQTEQTGSSATKPGSGASDPEPDAEPGSSPRARRSESSPQRRARKDAVEPRGRASDTRSAKAVVAGIVVAFLALGAGLVHAHGKRRGAEARADAARGAEREARRGAQRSDSVAQLLRDALRGGAEGTAPGDDAPILQHILAGATERLAADLEGEPELEVELRTLAGDLHAHLAMPAQAEDQYARALAVARGAASCAPATAGLLERLGRYRPSADQEDELARANAEVARASAPAGAARLVTRPHRVRRVAARLALTGAGLGIALGGGELLARTFFAEELELQFDERNLLYRHDERLGWFPKGSSATTFEGSHTFRVAHNGDGFRDRDHDLADPRPRVLFLGDSFTWGYDVEQEERFTELLQRELPEADVFNLGVSGYGTDQELLLFERFGQRYAPRLVVLVFCAATDPGDNELAVNYGGYAKPWYETEDDELVLRGVPVPEGPRMLFARNALLRGSYLARLVASRSLDVPEPSPGKNLTVRLVLELRRRVQALDARLLVAFTSDYPALEAALDRVACPRVSLHAITVSSDRSKPATVFPDHGQHWNRLGHERVAEVLKPHVRELTAEAPAEDAARAERTGRVRRRR